MGAGDTKDVSGTQRSTVLAFARVTALIPGERTVSLTLRSENKSSAFVSCNIFVFLLVARV